MAGVYNSNLTARLNGIVETTKNEVTGKDGSPLIPVQQMTDEQIKAEIERIRESRNK